MKPVNLLKAAAVLLSLGGVVPAASAQMMASPTPAVMPADYEFVLKAAYGGGARSPPRRSPCSVRATRASKTSRT